MADAATEEAEEVKSFTSWKLDVINALMIGVAHREFRVGVCLVQYANRHTKLINPSQSRIAAQLDVSVSTVERAICRLVEDELITKSRKNHHNQNTYSFNEQKIAGMLDVKIQRIEAWKDLRSKPRALKTGHSDPADVTGQKSPDPADVQVSDPADVQVSDPADVTGKHLSTTPVVEHLKEGATIEEAVDRGYGGTGSPEDRLPDVAPQQAHQPAGRSFDPSEPFPGTTTLAETAVVRQIRKVAVDPQTSLDALEQQQLFKRRS